MEDRFSPLYLVMKSHNPLDEEAKKGENLENNELKKISALIMSHSTLHGKASMVRANEQQQR